MIGRKCVYVKICPLKAQFQGFPAWVPCDRMDGQSGRNPMQTSRKYTPFVTIAITLVWLYFGLYCKVLNQQPHHREIVGRVLGADLSVPVTTVIGLAEIVMAAWVLSRWRPRLCAVAQIAAVGIMNALEFFAARNLLLFAGWNVVIALAFIAVVVFHGFFLLPNSPGKLTR